MNAVDAAVAVAESHGVHCENPLVLSEAWQVLVHLWPAPVVARVTSGASGVDPAGVEQELAVARHAARAGAPVVRPSDLLPPGPHRYDGRTLVFWNYLVQEGKLDATAAGRGLRAIHDSLADYDGELPRAGRAEEVRAMLQPFAPSEDVELLCELAARELPEGQALHGDAHLFNCIRTAAGPIWHDLETACRGPREYDLAALVLDDRSRGSDPEARLAIAAYGNYDEELLDQAIPVPPGRRVQTRTRAAVPTTLPLLGRVAHGLALRSVAVIPTVAGTDPFGVSPCGSRSIKSECPTAAPERDAPIRGTPGSGGTWGGAGRSAPAFPGLTAARSRRRS